MNYTPHTERDIQHMLNAIGVASTDDLFAPVPESLRLNALNLPPGISEMEAMAFVQSLTDCGSEASLSFLGGGAYDHFSPSVVDAIISRGEFFTAYTPYQPEVSQGTLRAIFEFQSMICELTNMEVANASMYDGASALAEAVLMSVRLNNRTRILLPRSLHPFYRQVVSTYVRGIDLELVDIPWSDSGTLDIPALKRELNLSAIRPPGDFGADIVVGDGQPLGLPLSYGGPYVGFFASRDAHVRKMPGRICGQTTDVDGKRGFVLTLQTREQHIRRERATSNICTNQTLCATAATVYLSSVGPQGFREVGELNWHQSHRALQALTTLDGVRQKFSGAIFNEFVLETDRKASDILTALRHRGIEAGIDLGRFYPELENCILTCVTEKRTDADIDRLIDAWRTL